MGFPQPGSAASHITVTQGTATSLVLTFDNNGSFTTSSSGVENGSLTDGYWKLTVGGFSSATGDLARSTCTITCKWTYLAHEAEGWQADFRGYLGTASGQRVLSVEAIGDFQMPYYAQGQADKFNGDYWMIRMVNSNPPVRAGEAITGRLNLDQDKSATWVYLTGQRRVRKLPNACCDTPTPATGGGPASTRWTSSVGAPTASTGASSASRRC